MNETENLKLALDLIKKNKISSGIKILEKSKNSYSLKILGILFCISGEFKKARSLFLKLKDLEDVSKYLLFLEETIKSEYIPKYNHMIELTRKKQNSQEIEKVFIELEKLSPNTELYNIAILFYINKNDIKKAYNYYIKLKSMDSSFKNNDKFENFFKDKKINNKLIINHSLQIILVLVSIFLVTKNLNLKENLETKNKETINLKKEIKIVKDKNEKLANFEEKFLSLAKSEKIAFKNKVEEEKIFTNNELYNLVLKRFKDNKYNEALKISEKIEISQLPEYKAKELIFIKGQAYEKTSQKDLSLKFYKEFLEKYNKPEYLNYIKLTKQKIIKLEKEMQ